MSTWAMLRTHRDTATVEARGGRILGLALIVAACVSAGVVLWSTQTDAEGFTFRGTVVDGETGTPLEAAVVVVVWRGYEPNFAGTPAIPYKVVSSSPAPDGGFEVDHWAGIVRPGLLRRMWRSTNRDITPRWGAPWSGTLRCSGRPSSRW